MRFYNEQEKIKFAKKTTPLNVSRKYKKFKENKELAIRTISRVEKEWPSSVSFTRIGYTLDACSAAQYPATLGDIHVTPTPGGLFEVSKISKGKGFGVLSKARALLIIAQHTKMQDPE